MSAGNPIVKCRVPKKLLAAVELQILQRNMNTAREPWTMSDFLVTAIREKLAKMERCRRGNGKNLKEDA